MCGKFGKKNKVDENAGLLTCYGCHQKNCKIRCRREKGPENAKGSASSGYISVFKVIMIMISMITGVLYTFNDNNKGDILS